MYWMDGEEPLGYVYNTEKIEAATVDLPGFVLAGLVKTR